MPGDAESRDLVTDVPSIGWFDSSCLVGGVPTCQRLPPLLA